MSTSRHPGLTDGPPVPSSGTASADRHTARSRRRALLSLAAIASVLTAGCTPLVNTGGHSTGAPKPPTSGHLTFAASADAYVYGNPASATNTGASSRLVASPEQDQGTASYLKFIVSGVPAGRYVTGAHLFLHRSADPLPPTLNVSATSSSWSETVINGSNAPAVGPSVATVHPTSSTWSVNVDVTAAFKNGNGPYTFAITDPVADSIATFFSRQGEKNQPSLVVYYGPNKPATQPVVTPTPTSTPTPDPTQTPTPDPTQTPSPTPTPTPTPTTTPTPVGGNCTVSSMLVPSCGVWWGLGAVPLGSESYDQALTNLENQEGRPADLIHFYHTGTQLFPSASDIAMSTSTGRNQILMENWKPELGHTWAQVAAGVPQVDQEIDNEAAYIKTHYTKKFFLSVHHEPENEIIPTAGSGYTAADYAAMYRHVVLRLKADGVTNAIFTMDYMGYSKWCEASWFSQLYPGDDVVDWIAYDPYSTGAGTFATMADGKDGTRWAGFYKWATTVHPDKPLMLAEWGVTETSDPNAKANFFNNMPTLEKSYPAIKALIYWNSGGYPTRIDSSPQSLAAFRALAQNPMYNTPLPF